MAEKLAIQIDLQTQAPLIEKRGPVQKKEDLYKADSWSYDIDSSGRKVFYVHEGMLVSVLSSREVYMLVDVKNIENDKGWELVMGNINQVELDGGSAEEYYADDQVIVSGGAADIE